MLRALIDAYGQRWTQQDEMLATVIDLLYAMNRELIAQRARKKSDIPKPQRWPRPNAAKSKPISLGELARRLA